MHPELLLRDAMLDAYQTQQYETAVSQIASSLKCDRHAAAYCLICGVSGTKWDSASELSVILRLTLMQCSNKN